MKKQTFFAECHSSVSILPFILCVIFIINVILPASAQLTPEDIITIRKHTGLMPLTGPQEGRYGDTKYLIINTVTVDSGQSLRFSEGTQLFFHKNAHIDVKGTLMLKGSSQKPITIGRLQISLPKISGQATETAVDTHSITIHDNAKFFIQNTIVTDSSISIHLNENGLLFLDTVTFADNSIQFPDTTLICPEKAVITCMSNRGKQFNECIPELPRPQSASSFQIQLGNMILPIRIGLGTGAAAATALWGYYNWKTGEYAEKYEAAELGDATPYFNANHRNARYRTIAAIFAGAGFSLFTLTFTIGGNGK